MSEQYIVSARKYRPDSFRSIVGQGAMSRTLQNAILNGKLAHAYLFSGPRGVGKTTAARVLAKTINCQNVTTEGEACNKCESCVSFNEQRSFNIFELDAASNNSVADIRQLTEQVLIPPSIGKYKVYIIDEVHMLSNTAFNAFLKTLEEPPSYAIFILATTEKHKILPTILSRCQTYDFKRITVNDIADHLAYVAECENIDIDRASLEVIAEKADGGMRDALSIFDRIVGFSIGPITYEQTLDSLNILDYSYFIKILDYVISADYKSVMITIDEILAKGFDAQLIVSGMASFLRDLLVVQHPSTAHLLEKPAMVAKAYTDIASRCNAKSLFDAINKLNDCDVKYREATNKRLHTEIAFLSLISSFASVESAGTESTSYKKKIILPAKNDTNTENRPVIKELSGKDIVTDRIKTGGDITVGSNAANAENVHSVAMTTGKTIAGSLSSLKKKQSGSMLDLMKRKEQDATSIKTDENNSFGNDSFDEGKLQNAWLLYEATKLPERERPLHSLMKTFLPEIKENGIVELKLNSTTSKESLSKYMPDIVDFVRKELNNSSVSISMVVEFVENKFIPMTGKDRLEKMKEKSPAVAMLVDTLGLQLT